MSAPADPRTRMSIDVYTLGALEDALGYYLSASADNFGAGYGDEDSDDVEQQRFERSLVADFAGRVEDARKRLERR